MEEMGGGEKVGTWMGIFFKSNKFKIKKLEYLTCLLKLWSIVEYCLHYFCYVVTKYLTKCNCREKGIFWFIVKGRVFTDDGLVARVEGCWS